MTVQTTYPGVYIVEKPSGSHVITGVSTSVTAFVGAARKGVSGVPLRVASYAEFLRQFGDPIDDEHPMGQAVAAFFLNGGAQAVVVRALPATAQTAGASLGTVGGVTVTLSARSPGEWANGVSAAGNPARGIFVQVLPSAARPDDRFDLSVTQWEPGPAGGPASSVAQESWRELSMSRGHPRHVGKVLAASKLVTATVEDSAPSGTPTAGTSTSAEPLPAHVPGVSGAVLRVAIDQGSARDLSLHPASDTPADIAADLSAQLSPHASAAVAGDGRLVLTSASTDLDSAVSVGLVGVDDASIPLRLGVATGGAEVSGSAQYRPGAMGTPTGLTSGSDGGPVTPGDIGTATAALRSLVFPRFNLLCLPGLTTADPTPLAAALDFCRTEKAFLLVDPAPGVTADGLVGAVATLRGQGAHGAVYWPRLVTPESGPAGLPPCGAVAGVMARTDADRGVWKAPAGTGAGLVGVLGTVYPTDDHVSGALNPSGLNVLRSFPTTGLVVWGARTLAGADGAASADFRYVPVRRLTDYLAASLYLGTQFAVFEPNDPVLWGQLRLAVTAFLDGLFRQGAFQQSEKRTPSDSFFVVCDSSVNPQSEIDAGRVNIVVGFAPLKPAEFVIVTITQISQTGA